MSNWFHRLFNPHCSHCKEERELIRNENYCKTCDTLKLLLAQERAEKERILSKLIDPPIIQQAEVEIKTPPKLKTWALERQRLEKEDRQRAQQIKENLANETKTTEELEKELGLG